MRWLVLLLSISCSAQIPVGNVCNGLFSGNLQCVTPQGRIYRVVVPANLPPDAPIFIALHPSAPAYQYAANGMMSTTGWNSTWAYTNKAIAIFPEATVDANGKKNWCIDFGTSPCRVDDVAFIRALILKYESLFATDLHRVGIAGFSMGADMAFKMARDASDVVSSVAILEGHQWTLPVGKIAPRPTYQDPVNVLIFSGRYDSILPTCGGIAGGGQTVPSVDQDMAWWAQVDGLSGLQTICPAKTITHTVANGAKAIEFYLLPKGGHNWYRTSMTDSTLASYQPDVAKTFPAGTNESAVITKFFLTH